MSSTVHVHQMFHAVGHGTFFTGMIDSDQGNQFHWIYDCGSKRPTRVIAEMDGLEAWPRWAHDKDLDLLVVSHFDNDHVNGLEELLRRHRVRYLALPYIGLRDRLGLAASLGGDDVASAATSLFSLDPIRYLESRGLTNRVDTIVMIQGGKGEGVGDNSYDWPGPDKAPEQFERTRGAGGSGLEEEYGITSSSSDGPRTTVWPHQLPLRAGLFPLEFTFFNTALPGTVANRSKATLPEIRADVETVLQRYRLLDPTQSPKRDWRQSLRACYEKHFGSGGPERNNISLCVLVRPFCNDVEQCGLFSGCSLGEGIWVWEVPVVPEEPRALLLTGDLALNPKSISEMRRHFQDWRWREIAVAQVPHHGSQHSWERGNAALFPGPAFVHCIPTSSRGNHHPHTDVVADLAGQLVLTSTYEQCVVHAYHFEWPHPLTLGPGYRGR